MEPKLTLNPIFELIKNEDFKILIQNINEYFKYVTSGKDIEQILGSFCQFLYNTSTFSEDIISLMAKAVVAFISKANEASMNLSNVDVMKALYYIIVFGVKKGLSNDMTLKLSKEFESFLSNCEDFSINHSDLLKKLYTTLWNASLQKGITPQIAFLLQGHAIGLVSLVTENFDNSCNYAHQVGQLAERNNCSREDIEYMYERVILRLTNTLNRKPTITTSTIISLSRLLIEYGRCLYITKKCNKYSRIFRPLINSLESLYDEKIILSLKMSVKIVEVAINYASDLCNESTILKTLHGCSHISWTSETANVILLEGLRYVYQLFSGKKMIAKLPSGIYSVFDCITYRIKVESQFTTDSLLKIMDLYGNHLSHFVTELTSSSADKISLFTKIDKCSSALSILLPKIENLKAEPHVYNIGVICCNLGVIAYQSNDYIVASKILDFGVNYLFANYGLCDEIQKVNVLRIIKKKAVLLKDCLRYCGKYKEATLKAFQLVALDIFEKSELLITWIKCKRDSYKNNSQALKNICISDIYSEALSIMNDKSININIEELVMEEIQELRKLSFYTQEAESYCARTLITSENPMYSLEGYLAYAITLWTNPETTSENISPINVLNKGLKKINSLPKECEMTLEYKARIMFWLYLCNLQIIQNKAEEEVEEEIKSNSLVQSTDLGEEVQPNDVCSIRPAMSLVTFDSQDKNMTYIDQSLELWEAAIKLSKPHKLNQACSDLLSIGYIYKLSGILPSTIKAFTLLLALANKYGQDKFWVQGVTELMDIIPELISTDVAKRVEDLVNFDKTPKDKSREYFHLSTLSSLAYFYLRKGELKLGAELIKKCLENSIMEQRTPTAIEVQIMVYYVASQYLFLPKSMLPNLSRENGDAFFLAMNATRKAIGLLRTSYDDSHKTVCYRHKIAWLHHRTNLWLGRLCHLTAQPRLARAYLRQALTLSEKFALPIRIVELLCTLSEIDLQCDQFDDCRIKIDSMESLFKFHCSRSKNKLNYEDTIEIKLHKRKGKASNYLEPSCKTQVQNDVRQLIPIYVDDENMRENECSPAFELNEPSSQFGKQLIVIGQEKRIDGLAQPSVGCASPSPKFLPRSFSSRCKVEDICPVCVTPELLSVIIQVYVFLGVIDAHKENTDNSQISFRQAEKELKRVFDEYGRVVSHLESILSFATSKWGSIMNENIEEKNNFINFQISQAKLSLMFHRNETSLDKKNIKITKSKIVETLKEINSLQPIVLAYNHPLVAQLILHCQGINNTLNKNSESSDDIQKLEAYSPPTVTSRMSSVSSFQTPLRSCLKTSYKKLPVVPSVNRPAYTPFRIFKDDCDWSSSSSEKEKGTSTQVAKIQKGKGTNVLSPLPFKTSVNTRVKPPMLKLDLSNDSSTSSSNLSPFSEVLKLPSTESVGSDTSTRSRRCKIVNTKDKVKKTTSRIKVKSDKEVIAIKSDMKDLKEEVKENSPIVKTKAKSTTLRSKACAGKVVKDSTSIVTSTRETRSRRNLQRL